MWEGAWKAHTVMRNTSVGLGAHRASLLMLPAPGGLRPLTWPGHQTPPTAKWHLPLAPSNKVRQPQTSGSPSGPCRSPVSPSSPHPAIRPSCQSYASRCPLLSDHSNCLLAVPALWLPPASQSACRSHRHPSESPVVFASHLSAPCSLSLAHACAHAHTCTRIRNSPQRPTVD